MFGDVGSTEGIQQGITNKFGYMIILEELTTKKYFFPIAK